MNKGSRKLYRVGTHINQFVMRNKLDFTLQSITIIFLIALATMTTYNVVVYGASNDELVITTR
jgi:hypothetical protein